jgi:hypothetical protein
VHLVRLPVVIPPQCRFSRHQTFQQKACRWMKEQGRFFKMQLTLGVALVRISCFRVSLLQNDATSISAIARETNLYPYAANSPLNARKVDPVSGTTSP